MCSDDDLDEEVLLQVGDYPAPTPSGLYTDVPSTTLPLPQVGLVTAQKDGGKRISAQTGEPARDLASTPILTVNIANGPNMATISAITNSISIRFIVHVSFDLPTYM